MALRSFDRDDELISDINIIPLVDISLVLLIIFMVTANFIPTSYIKVDMPKAAHGKTDVSGGDSIALAVNSEGLIYWDKRVVTVKELGTKLSLRYKENKDIFVNLTADRRAEFNSIVEVIDAINGAGISKINVSTETIR